ncbi:MAG: hypothetical protein KQI62_08270 [Deltaproteobacteria bacterium]|nr:hypothetical protein [Deltaproteobacteria bacterium]
MAALPASRPNKVTTAVLLLYVSLGMGLLRALLGLPGLSQAQGQSLGMAGISLAVVAVVFAVMLFFILMIGQGRNWARITFAVLYVLGMIMMIAGLFSLPNLGAGAVMDLVQALLQLVALVLLFSPESNAWFQAAKAARRSG